MTPMTVKKWQDATDATGEPDDVNGDPLSLDAVITVSESGEEYCVGHYDGSQAWMRFDGDLAVER